MKVQLIATYDARLYNGISTRILVSWNRPYDTLFEVLSRYEVNMYGKIIMFPSLVMLFSGKVVMDGTQSFWIRMIAVFKSYTSVESVGLSIRSVRTTRSSGRNEDETSSDIDPAMLLMMLREC